MTQVGAVVGAAVVGAAVVGAAVVGAAVVGAAVVGGGMEGGLEGGGVVGGGDTEHSEQPLQPRQVHLSSQSCVLSSHKTACTPAQGRRALGAAVAATPGALGIPALRLVRLTKRIARVACTPTASASADITDEPLSR